jgi:hypothetical protein
LDDSSVCDYCGPATGTDLLRERLAVDLILDERDVAILTELRYDYPDFVIYKKLTDILGPDGLFARLTHFRKHKLVQEGIGWRVTSKGLGLLHEYECDSVNHSSSQQ